MLISQTVQLTWNPRIKRYYIDLGYTYTKMKDKFTVKVSDLTNSSNVIVDVKCDYCQKPYKKYWYHYKIENEKEIIHKDCCNECKQHKIQETAIAKYGVNTVFKLQNVKSKIANTNLNIYGVENPFASNEIKQKIVDTNIKRYGVPYPIQNEKVLQKTIKTCREKYGVDYYIETQRFSGENSPVWKGGIAKERNERLTYDYQKWRNAVFKRDYYTCQKCKNKNGNGETIYLNAHHIKNWKDNPDDRYDESNGITLCQNCHNEFHSLYGKKNNTEKQLESFLKNNGKKVC